MSFLFFRQQEGEGEGGGNDVTVSFTDMTRQVRELAALLFLGGEVVVVVGGALM